MPMMPMRLTIVDQPDPLPQDDFFIRLPPPKGRCHYTGLARTTLRELIERSGGKIKAKSLKKPGAIRGVTLIHLGSLRNYLSSLPDIAAPGQAESAERAKMKGLCSK